MGSYKVYFKKSAEKELRVIPRGHLSKIIEKIKSLAKNPRPQGSELLKGEDRYYRIRQSDYRIVYEVDDNSSCVTIVKIGHRRDIYR